MRRNIWKSSCVNNGPMQRSGRRPAIKLPASGTWDYLVLGPAMPATCRLHPARHGQPYRGHRHTTAHQNDRDWALANACTLSTGEFLLARSTTEKADATRLKLLQAAHPDRRDARYRRSGSHFPRGEPNFPLPAAHVNIGSHVTARPITSFAQAINLLGRQLQRWLQLLVYSDPTTGQHPTPLLQFSRCVRRLIELLVPACR